LPKWLRAIASISHSHGFGGAISHLVRLVVSLDERVVPRGHPLASAAIDLKKWPSIRSITYVFAFRPSSLARAVRTAGLSLDVALTARDSDVIKTYVRIG